ncbi:MAG: alpha/beta fold hydrolase [Chitinophagales bacterium]
MLAFSISTIILLFALLYFMQERLLFFPSKLPKNYTYHFSEVFEEVNLEVAKNIHINALLFKTNQQESKGVLLFLHGNGGAIHGWGTGAGLYTGQGYDVFYVDYRGYGKSDGKIKSENQLVEDAQIAYDYLKKHYAENTIIVSGTSMGTGIAAQIAAQNQPLKLLLNSPYFSLQSLILEKVKVIPNFLIKYKFKTFQHFQQVKCPITIFHGDKDTVIPHSHSLQLEEKYPHIKLYLIEGAGHNDLINSKEYDFNMKAILSI